MDIVCAKTGRHFNGIEVARDCSSNHDHCNDCPWDKPHQNIGIHFIAQNPSHATQQEIERLMADINAHLKPTVLSPQNTLFDSNHIGYYKDEEKPRRQQQGKRQDKSLWIVIGLALFIFLLWYFSR